MGWRFRQSIRIFPGFRLNFSKSGISTSIGPRGASLNIGARGLRTTFGLPGTGISYSTLHSGGAASGGDDGSTASTPPNRTDSVGCMLLLVPLLILLGLLAMCRGQQPAPAKAPEIEPILSSVAVSELAYAKTKVNCRRGPSTKAAIDTKVAGGTSVVVLGQDDDFTRVISAGKQCYIASRLLSNIPVLIGAAAAISSTKARANSKPARAYGDDCPCSGRSYCIGPRGGRYCYTSSGNKRYR